MTSKNFLLTSLFCALWGIGISGSVLAESQTPPALESLRNLNAEAPTRRALNIQRWQTAEGARVLFVEAHELPMFDLRLTFAAGSSRDGTLPGLALMTNALLNEGVADKDATAIAQTFEGLGAQFSNGAYRDMALVSLRSLSATEQREPALALFQQVVSQPSFPADALERIRNQLLAGLEQQKQNPAKLASLELFSRLYGQHPYSIPTEGTFESLPRIDEAQVHQFHQQGYAAGNLVIALVGDLQRSEAEQIAAQLSAALPKGPALANQPEPKTPVAGRYQVEYPSQQTHVLMAQLGIRRTDPDYAALYLGNQILGGGGFGTRLMEEVREKRGLTYGIYSRFSPMDAPGPFSISVQTRAEQTEGTLALIQKLVQDYLAEGPTQEELERNQREITGSFPLSTASNADIAGQISNIGFYNLPSSFLEDFTRQIQQLTVQQVKEAMQRHLSPEQFVIVTAGPKVAQQPLPEPSADAPKAEPLGVPEH